MADAKTCLRRDHAPVIGSTGHVQQRVLCQIAQCMKGTLLEQRGRCDQGSRPWARAGRRRGQAKVDHRRWLKAQGLGRYPAAVVLSNFQRHLDALEGRLSRDSWLCGDTASTADIAVAAQLDEVVRTSRHTDEIRERPNLDAWLLRCQFGKTAEAPIAGAQTTPILHG